MIPVLVGLAILGIALVIGAYQSETRKRREAAPESAKPMYDMLGLWSTQGTPGDPTTDSEYAAKTDKLIHDWALQKGLPLSLLLPGRSPLTPAEAPKEASRIIDSGLALITTLNSVGIIAEAASLGQVESVIWAITNTINATGLPNVIQDLYRTPMEIGLKIPLQRRMYSDYQPKIPEPGTLVSLRSRGMLADWAYGPMMREHGYPDWASEMMAYAETRFPDFSSMVTLYARGFITGDTFKTWLRRSGLHPDVVDPLTQLRWQLPGYADIISVYMREGYLEEKWVEIPTEFVTYMEQLGFSRDWALRLWGKHWVLPSVDLLYDMYHKKIIDLPAITAMLKYHDFEPVWRQRLIDNAYRMIPRVDLRRAYRYGTLKAEDLRERYEWLGYKPLDAQIMSGIAQRESLTPYYTRLETVARAAFRKGKLSETDFVSILRAINTPDAAVALTLQAEKLAREAAVLEIAEEPRTLTAGQLLRLSQLDLLDLTETRTRLLALGFSEIDADLLIAMNEPKPEPVEVNRELITASSSLYREGLMSPAEYMGYLRKAGLTEPEIQTHLEAEDLRYRMDYLRDLVALAKEAYKKDVYAREEFEAHLLYYGMQLERVKAVSALEQLRKLPKPKG